MPIKLPTMRLSAAGIEIPAEVLKPIVFAEPAVVPPIVLLAPITTPTLLPRLSPAESVPIKLDNMRLPVAEVPPIDTPAEVLKPIVLPVIVFPVAGFVPSMKMPTRLPGPGAVPLLFVPIKSAVIVLPLVLT